MMPEFKDAMQVNVSLFNPRLFKIIGGIQGLTKIFKLFFAAALKDERLANMYQISPENLTAVDNLRRKYTHMLGSMMGSHIDWKGGSLA